MVYGLRSLLRIRGREPSSRPNPWWTRLARMAIISCGWCGHDGAHATTEQTIENGIKKCTGCSECYPPTKK
jgi:hypothetical protein